MLKENETSFSGLQNATNQKTIEQNTLSPNRVIKKSKCFIYVGHLNVKANTVLSQWENVFWEKMEKGKNMSMEKDHKIGDKRNVHEQRMWMIIVQMKRTSERRREKKDGREIEAKVRSHRRRWIELGDMKAIKTADTRSVETHTQIHEVNCPCTALCVLSTYFKEIRVRMACEHRNSLTLSRLSLKWLNHVVLCRLAVVLLWNLTVNI